MSKINFLDRSVYLNCREALGDVQAEIEADDEEVGELVKMEVLHLDGNGQRM